MAYLDEDILYNNIEEKYKSAKGKARAAYSDVLDTICEMPRADVVSKSEVDRLEQAYNARLAKDIQTNADFIKHAKAEVAREIFEEIEKLIEPNGEWLWRWDLDRLAELKKKYERGEIEGEQNS